MFESVDKKFEKIGFKKIEENDLRVSYERYVKDYDYTQVLDILHKRSGYHIVQSYEKRTDGVVGLKMYEMKLCLKKMKEKRWKTKK